MATRLTIPVRVLLVLTATFLGCGDDESDVTKCVGGGCPGGAPCDDSDANLADCGFEWSEDDPCSGASEGFCITMDGNNEFAVNCGDTSTAEECTAGCYTAQQYGRTASACMPISDLYADAGTDASTSGSDGGPADGGPADGGPDGGPDSGTPGICMSLQFDGTGADGVSTADVAAFDFSGPFTVEAWVKLAGTPASSSVVAGQVDDMLVFPSYYLGVNSGGFPIFYIHDGSSGQNLPATTALTMNVWTHIAGVYDGTNMGIFINGTQSDDGYAWTTAPQAGTGLRIGDSSVSMSTSYQFNGWIDEVRVSSVARYAVAASEPSSPTFTPELRHTSDGNTVGLYHLDTVDSASTPDSSSTSADAMITGTVPLVSDCPGS